jgi:hypothetical protein
LEPLNEYLGLSHAKLEKIFLRLPAVLAYDHETLVHEGGAGATASIPGFECCGAEGDRAADTKCVQLHPRQPGEGEAGAAASTSGFE